MNKYLSLALIFCVSALTSSPLLSFDIKEAKQQAHAQKKQYKKMKALIKDIEDCWRAHKNKFNILMEHSNFAPSSEIVSVYAEELQAIHARCLALEKLYERSYPTTSPQETKD